MKGKEINNKRGTEKEAFVKASKVTKEQMKGSAADFDKNIKPLFEELDAWRRESASSQIRVS